MGEEMRNEKVTPRGTPASTNPIKRGTAEHEQNGVTMPSKAASILPIISFLCVSIILVFSGEKYERMTATIKTIVVSSKNILMVSYTKKFSAYPTWPAGCSFIMV
jgi:hypothetical protein